MQYKDKIILVFYVGCKNIHHADVAPYLRQVAEAMECKMDDSAEFLFIPSLETSETHVECINPKLLTESEYKSAKDTVSKIKENLNEFLEIIKLSNDK